MQRLQERIRWLEEEGGVSAAAGEKELGRERRGTHALWSELGQGSDRSREAGEEA